MDSVMQESDSAELVSSCPSFNSYSTDQLAHVAHRVTLEEEEEGENEPQCPTAEDNTQNLSERLDDHETDDDDFEFVSLVKNFDHLSIDSDQIRTVFPVFNRDLVFGDDEDDRTRFSNLNSDASSIRIPLKNIFVDDHDHNPPSSSSSEADELDGIPEGTYCMWTPRSSLQSSPNRVKIKSNSTGSCSKRWRLRDLLKRNNSDRKDSSSSPSPSFVFLTPFPSSANKKSVDGELGLDNHKRRNSNANDKNKGEISSPNKYKDKKVNAHEVFYVRSRALKEGDKKRSYLPYRKDLVGFFANVNGLGKSFAPF